MNKAVEILADSFKDYANEGFLKALFYALIADTAYVEFKNILKQTRKEHKCHASASINVLSLLMKLEEKKQQLNQNKIGEPKNG